MECPCASRSLPDLVEDLCRKRCLVLRQKPAVVPSDDGGSLLVAIFDNLEEIAALLVIQLLSIGIFVVIVDRAR